MRYTLDDTVSNVLFHTTDSICRAGFPSIFVTIVMFDVQAFVGFPGPVGPGPTRLEVGVKRMGELNVRVA